MQKKVLKSLILLVLMALGLTSCSDSSDNPSSAVDDKEFKADADKTDAVTQIIVEL